MIVDRSVQQNIADERRKKSISIHSRSFAYTLDTQLWVENFLISFKLK